MFRELRIITVTSLTVTFVFQLFLDYWKPLDLGWVALFGEDYNKWLILAAVWGSVMAIVSVTRFVFNCQGEGLSLGETLTFWLSVIKASRSEDAAEKDGADASDWRDWMPGNRHRIGRSSKLETEFERLFTPPQSD